MSIATSTVFKTKQVIKLHLPIEFLANLQQDHVHDRLASKYIGWRLYGFKYVGLSIPLLGYKKQQLTLKTIQKDKTLFKVLNKLINDVFIEANIDINDWTKTILM